MENKAESVLPKKSCSNDDLNELKHSTVLPENIEDVENPKVLHESNVPSDLKALSNDDGIIILPDEIKDADNSKDLYESNVPSDVKALSNDDGIVILPDEIKGLDIAKDFLESNAPSDGKVLSNNDNSNEPKDSTVANDAKRRSKRRNPLEDALSKNEKVSGKRRK